MLDEVGSAKLFVDDSKAPFIFIETNSEFIILNVENSDQTKELYKDLLAEWK